ncbi:Salicylate carboxymethyltransferase [Bienertia sinuspersici]
MKEKALRKIYYNQQPTTICIADLGCSSAEHTLMILIFEFIHTIEKARRELKDNDHGLQEYQVYLNDLPWNDFNTLFKSLGNFKNMTFSIQPSAFCSFFI